jgi:hypothetical protein
MPNRILKDSVCTSDNLDHLTAEQEVFWYRLLVQCDDYGRMDARPAILRARCYPLRLGTVSEQDVADWLDALVASDLVNVYEVAGKSYLQVTTWDRHQQVRAKRSKYPPMIADDSNGYQMIADDSTCTRNPIQSNPNPTRESESKENPTRPPVFADGSGYSAVSRASKWNNQVSAELRTPIADVILDIIGKRSLADVGGTLGDKILDAAHECAVTIYKLGYRTPESLLDIEPAWRQNWRGKDGGGTPEQLATFAAELKGAAKSSGNGNRPHGAQPGEVLTSWTSPDGRERIIGHADGREERREPLEF